MDNNQWERKSLDVESMNDSKYDDLFRCHKCNQWNSWFYFTKGYRLAFQFSTDDDNTFLYMSGEKSRGGRRWACNTCLYKILCDNNILLIE